MQGRLLAVTDSAGNAQSWSYDGNGNLLTGVLNGQTTLYSYTASITPNELLTQTLLGSTCRRRLSSGRSAGIKVSQFSRLPRR